MKHSYLLCKTLKSLHSGGQFDADGDKPIGTKSVFTRAETEHSRYLHHAEPKRRYNSKADSQKASYINRRSVLKVIEATFGLFLIRFHVVDSLLSWFVGGGFPF